MDDDKQQRINHAIEGSKQAAWRLRHMKEIGGQATATRQKMPFPGHRQCKRLYRTTPEATARKIRSLHMLRAAEYGYDPQFAPPAP